MVQILSIHMAGGEQHEHISELEWRNTDTGVVYRDSRDSMVAFVRQNPGQAFVNHGGRVSYLGVVNGLHGLYVRTHADGFWNDNLLALPRY